MESRIRALALSINANIDCAMNNLVWRDHPEVIEDLKNAQELLDVIMQVLGDPDDPEELDFDY